MINIVSSVVVLVCMASSAIASSPFRDAEFAYKFDPDHTNKREYSLDFEFKSFQEIQNNDSSFDNIQDESFSDQKKINEIKSALNCQFMRGKLEMLSKMLTQLSKNIAASDINLKAGKISPRDYLKVISEKSNFEFEAQSIKSDLKNCVGRSAVQIDSVEKLNGNLFESSEDKKDIQGLSLRTEKIKLRRIQNEILVSNSENDQIFKGISLTMKRDAERSGNDSNEISLKFSLPFLRDSSIERQERRELLEKEYLQKKEVLTVENEEKSLSVKIKSIYNKYQAQKSVLNSIEKLSKISDVKYETVLQQYQLQELESNYYLTFVDWVELSFGAHKVNEFFVLTADEK